MSESRAERDAIQESSTLHTQSARYPTNHVLAIIDTPEQLAGATRALQDGGFLASEMEVACGEAAADVLHANTGRTGLAHLAIRLARKLGISDDEMAVKDGYEEALRDGRFVVVVLAPTEERKNLAGQILREHGAHFVNFLGRLSIEILHR